MLLNWAAEREHHVVLRADSAFTIRDADHTGINLMKFPAIPCHTGDPVVTESCDFVPAVSSESRDLVFKPLAVRHRFSFQVVDV